MMPRDLLAIDKPKDLLEKTEPRDLLAQAKPAVREPFGLRAAKAIGVGLVTPITPESLKYAADFWTDEVEPDPWYFSEDRPEQRWEKWTRIGAVAATLGMGARHLFQLVKGAPNVQVFMNRLQGEAAGIKYKVHKWKGLKPPTAIAPYKIQPKVGEPLPTYFTRMEKEGSLTKDSAFKFIPRHLEKQYLDWSRGARYPVTEPTPVPIPKVAPTPEIKAMALKSYTPTEFQSLPSSTQSAILSEKLKVAKSAKHRELIREKYSITTYEVRDIKVKPSEFKTPLTRDPTPSPKNIPSTSPAPQPTPAEKPKPVTVWNVGDFPGNALINKADPSTTRIIDSINGRIRNNILKTLEDFKRGKNPFKLNHIIDTPVAFQRLEERTGFPLYTKYGVNFSKARNIAAYEVATIVNRFTEGLKKGYQTAESTERIVSWIVKKKGSLTKEERLIATKLQDVFRETRDMVSYLRMRRFIDGAEKVPKELEDIVGDGERVFVKKGREGLEAWVKGKDIGLVTDDRYFPSQLLYKFRTHYSSDPFEVFNPHLHSREATEQIYDYSQSIVQKLHSYLTRMYSDYYMYDLLTDAKNDFSGTSMPYETISDIKRWLTSIQGKGVEVGWWGRVARQARGQFFKVTLADPTKIVRNYLQRYYMTLQNYPAIQHAMRTGRFFEYRMTNSEFGWFRRHVSQLRELEREQLYLYEKIFERGVLGKVDDLAIWLARRYTLIDEGNRYTTFKYALATNDRYIEMYKRGTLSLRGMLNKTGASSFYDLEIKHILSLPVDEARLEIAKLIVEKTQIRYKKTERGLSALSEAGEIATSLLQYPKGIITRYLDATDMILRGDSMEERWSGVRLLVGLIVLANVAQHVLESIAGESRYYDPELKRERVHDPYSLIGIIGSLQIAGAQPAHAVTLARVTKRISDLLYLEVSDGMPSEKYHLTAIRAILKDVDQLGEAYIPFLRIAMNGVEAAEGSRTHKLLTTWFDQKTRRQTALRRNKIKRDWIEGWRHFLFGREARER